jgi:hypothetical protein
MSAELRTISCMCAGRKDEEAQEKAEEEVTIALPEGTMRRRH